MTLVTCSGNRSKLVHGKRWRYNVKDNFAFVRYSQGLEQLPCGTLQSIYRSEDKFELKKFRQVRDVQIPNLNAVPHTP